MARNEDECVLEYIYLYLVRRVSPDRPACHARCADAAGIRLFCPSFLRTTATRTAVVPLLLSYQHSLHCQYPAANLIPHRWFWAEWQKQGQGSDQGRGSFGTYPTSTGTSASTVPTLSS